MNLPPTLPFVQVAVNVPGVSGVYDYHLPSELLGQVCPGSLVVIPFGRQNVQAIAVRLLAESGVPNIKTVAALLDPQPVVTPHQLKLAAWLSEEMLSPLAACLDGMLPPGLSQQADTLYDLLPFPSAQPPTPTDLSPTQQRILALIQKRGGLRGRQLEANFPHINWKESAMGLVRRGILVTRPVLPPPAIRPKVIRTASLACPPDAIEGKVEEVGRPGSTAYQRRKAMLEFLRKEALPVNVTWVYAATGGNLQDLVKLAEAGLVRLSETEVWRDPLEAIDTQNDTAPPLTTGQAAAWDTLRSGLLQAAAGTAPDPYLLHGVTGSGKTEIYLRAVEETIRLGRQAIVLVPEIALTPQTVRRFLARFPGQVGLVHSRLSTGERYDTWRRARAGLLPVIVGPRSALFAPVPDPGLIVLDECHDESYYQTENQPYYSSIETALAYGRIANSAVMLGSATPTVTQYYQAKQNGWTVLDLPRRILAHRQAVESHLTRLGISTPVSMAGEAEAASLELPPVEVVDMREELKGGNRSIFSASLKNALDATLAAKQQAILFLNRRGSSTYVFCRECGEDLRCPRCDLPLTLHLSKEGDTALTCHTCNYKRQMPKKCPTCGSTQIRQYGTGTEKVEAAVLESFPGARVLRWDADTAREKGSHEILLAHFVNHQADILIGTQMLAKGLDLPLVTMVGVVLADVGLGFPDFRAGERTFQLLTQVAGRAGRSVLGGQVILQTFQPEHYAILAASQHDYAGFYKQELAYRRKMNYPPFSRLVRLEFRSSENTAAEAAAKSAAQRLQDWIEMENRTSTALIGPVPCYFSRVNSQYRWEVVVRGPDPANFIRAHLPELAEKAYIQVDPPSLL